MRCGLGRTPSRGQKANASIAIELAQMLSTDIWPYWFNSLPDAADIPGRHDLVLV